jgi:hypothetical protein
VERRERQWEKGVDVGSIRAHSLQYSHTGYIVNGYIQGGSTSPAEAGARDTEAGVSVDVVLTGEYPGDGKPKPVVLPDPAEAAVRRRGVALLPLPKLIELKLTSGMSAPHRLKDLADVLELIRPACPDARDEGFPRCVGKSEVRGAVAGCPNAGARVTFRVSSRLGCGR